MANIMTTIKKFCTSNAKQTQTALVHTLAVIDHMLGESRDWTVAATLIAGTDSRMSPQIKHIIRECVGGIKLTKDEKQSTGLRFKLGDNFGPTEKLEVLRDLVEAGETIYSTKVEQGLLGKGQDQGDKPAKTKAEIRDYITKYAAKHGFILKSATLTEAPVEVEETA